MKVVEIFNSIDGEGKRAGELTTFIRLYGCNLNCSYCDSQYACTEENNYTEMSIDEILEECSKYKTLNVTVTGGEPLIHKDITWLLAALTENHYDVNVETNGSVSLDKYFNMNGDSPKTIKEKYENVWFTVDYKCPSSNMTELMFGDNFRNKYRNVIYKFVVGSMADLNTAYNVIKDSLLNGGPKWKGLQIYLSPVFGKIEPKQIVEYMQKQGMYFRGVPIKVQLQLHKFIWDPDKKGV